MAFLYLDTNILIALVEPVAALTPGQADLLERMERGDFVGLTSELALSECLVKPIADDNARAQAAYHDLFSARSSLLVFAVTRDVLVSAAALRAGVRLKLPDAIHLATAIQSGCTAFLTNDSDFKPGGLPVEIRRWDRL